MSKVLISNLNNIVVIDNNCSIVSLNVNNDYIGIKLFAKLILDNKNNKVYNKTTLTNNNQ